MITRKLLGLSALVTHKRNDNRKLYSHIYIVIKTDNGGNIGVASTNLGGKYTEQDALKAFKRQPMLFKRIDEGVEIAMAAKLL